MVDHARSTWRGSIRRACRALPVERSIYHYRSRRAGQAELTERIKEIAATRVRYGYRRIHVLLRRDGWRVNPKRVYRLYRELGLPLRNKTPKRRVKAKLRNDRRPATRSNETWAMDFVHDQLPPGGNCACSRSSIRSRASRRRWSRGSISAAPMLWSCSKGATPIGDRTPMSLMHRPQHDAEAARRLGCFAPSDSNCAWDKERGNVIGIAPSHCRSLLSGALLRSSVGAQTCCYGTWQSRGLRPTPISL